MGKPSVEYVSIIMIFERIARDYRIYFLLIFLKKTLDKFQDFIVKSARPNENDSHLGWGCLPYGKQFFS